MAAEYRMCWVLVCDACRAELQDPDEEFETAAQTLINQTLVLDEFQVIVDKLWPTDPTDLVGPRAAGIRDRRNTALRHLFTEADTQQSIRGTRWGALRAIPETLANTSPPATTDTRPTRGLTSSALARARQRPTTLPPPT